MIWMLDTDTLVYLANGKPGFERIVRRMSGRSPGELRLSAITLSELRFGIENGGLRTGNRQALTGLLGAMRDRFEFAPGAEVTTEANPETLTPAYLEGLRDGGFTRLSLGLQSVVPHVLRVLERVHTPSRGLDAAVMVSVRIGECPARLTELALASEP